MTYHTEKQTTTARTLNLDHVPFGITWKFKQEHAVLDDNDIVMVLGDRFQLGTVMGYAIENRECPIEAWNRALERDEQSHYAFGMAVVISNPPTIPDPPAAVLSIGEWVWFAGHAWEIVRTPNRNIGLRQVDLLAWAATQDDLD